MIKVTDKKHGDEHIFTFEPDNGCTQLQFTTDKERTEVMMRVGHPGSECHHIIGDRAFWENVATVVIELFEGKPCP